MRLTAYLVTTLLLTACGVDQDCYDGCDPKVQTVEGSTGKDGKDGAKGEAGEPGAIGQPGPQGNPGPQGVSGVAGPVGPAGPAGEAGLPGLPGAAGSQGPTGATGATGETGATGPQGQQGVPGVDGTSYGSEILSIEDINRNIPWDTNNSYTATGDGFLFVPEAFWNYSLPNTSSPSGGWVDIRVGSTIFCYQRDHNSYRYSLKYRKILGHNYGCDSNSEKYAGAFVLTPTIVTGTVIRVYPRDPKLAGIVWDLELRIMYKE